jgi:serine/threonine protein kinase
LQWIRVDLAPSGSVEGSAYVEGEEKPSEVARGELLYMRMEREQLYNERGRQRLNHEIEICSRLDHSNVVKFYGVSFALDGEPAMIIQWYGNGTVKDFAKDRDVACRLRLYVSRCNHRRLIH